MSKSKILVVEDENIIAKDICITLEKMGYAVSGMAASGEEAIEKTAEFKPDLVLMDIMLKGMLNGIDAAEQIRSRFDIPVIYLTAFSDEALLKKAKASEVFGYLIKPFKENELHAVIEMALYKHQIEKKLRNCQKLYNTVVEDSLRLYNAVVEDQTELICRYTSGMDVTFVNLAYCKYLGKPRDQIIGNSYFDLVHPKDRDKVKLCLSSLSPENSIVTIEQRLTSPFDEIRWQQFNHRALFDNHNCLSEFQSVGQDITARKKAEKVLQESEARFRTLFENIPLPVLIYDDSGIILHINEIGARQLNWSSSELVGFNITKIKPKGQDNIDYLEGILEYGSRNINTFFVSSKDRLIFAEVWESKIIYNASDAVLCIVKIISIVN